MPDRSLERNLFGARAFYRPMKTDLNEEAAAKDDSMDRRIIRVELPPAHAGVTAALRRAFANAPAANGTRDFDDLLARLG
jgi:hypothetical protein